jgi:hypothetical protein
MSVVPEQLVIVLPQSDRRRRHSHQFTIGIESVLGFRGAIELNQASDLSARQQHRREIALDESRFTFGFNFTWMTRLDGRLRLP